MAKQSQATASKQSKNKQQELDMDFNKVLVSANIKQTMKALGAPSGDRYQMPVEKVQFLPNFNVRIKNAAYWARVRTYADSMKRDGFKQDHPLSCIVVMEGGVKKVWYYAGYTRWDALALANKELEEEGKELITHVPSVAAPKGTTLEDLTNDLVTGNNGEKLQPFEVGIVCKRKLNKGQDEKQIAEDLGFTVSYVSDLLYLMGAPKEIRDMVQNDHIAAFEAVKIMREHGDKAVEVMQKSLERANAAGKTRVTAKFVPGRAYAKAVARSAPEMATAIKDLKADPGFDTLSPSMRDKISALLATIAEAEKAEGEAAKADPQASIKEAEVAEVAEAA